MFIPEFLALLVRLPEKIEKASQAIKRIAFSLFDLGVYIYAAYKFFLHR